jgi:hypothetical protein
METYRLVDGFCLSGRTDVIQASKRDGANSNNNARRDLGSMVVFKTESKGGWLGLCLCLVAIQYHFVRLFAS